ncbi:MAG: aspartate aminotransferase family protein [Candidatus Limnocylindria bacterium]
MSGDERARYETNTARSEELARRARAVLPGGNTRTTIYFDPYPFYAARGAGARIWDVDGNARLDLNGNYTSLILGHAPPAVVEAVRSAAERGLSFPAPVEDEIALAELLRSRIPSLERVRFTNSGTEATLNCVRAARAYTGRSKIAKFEGAYHGTHDAVMVSVSPDGAAAGPPRRPHAVPSAAGIPEGVLGDVVVLPWNDTEACVEIISAESERLAAVLVDPLLGVGGAIPPEPGFLAAIRAVTERHGILLIFDEVISFRVAAGGAQERFGIRPDLTALGKIIGGGLPVGAFGGRADIMQLFDPSGGSPAIAHGGTFNANPLTMAAGLATLRALDPAAYARLDALGDRLRAGVRDVVGAAGVAGHATGLGSLFCLHWTAQRPRDWRSSRPTDAAMPMRVFLGLLNEGVLLSQRGIGACSLAMEEADVDFFIAALERVLARSASPVAS